MVFYCCVPQCKGSGFEEGVSMHQFPRDLKQKEVWKERIRRSDDFVITQSTRICSKHFKKGDFHYYDTPRRVLLPSAVPSTFAWNKTPTRKSPKTRRIDDSEDTDTASENEERTDEDSCFLTFPKMAEQQVSEDLESAEYKKLLKYVLRKQIQLLVNQLNEETGEETVVLSANLTSGATTYLGSELARTYLEENSAWKTDFLSFLLTKNILRKGADATANKPKTSKPFKAAKESSDLASKSPTGTGLNINKGKSKSIVTAAETDTSYDDASQQLESKATNNKRKPAESPQSQTPRKSQKQSNLKGISTESCSVETLEMDAYTEAEQTALLNRSESFLFKDINRSEISEASEMNMTNLIPQSSVQDNPMFQPTIPIISTDANVDMGIDNAALGFPGISSDTNMGEIYIKIEPQEDSDSADVDYGNSGIEEANISDNPHSDQNTHSGEDNDRGLDNNGCSNKQQPSVQNMCANKVIKEEVVSEGSDAKEYSMVTSADVVANNDWTRTSRPYIVAVVSSDLTSTPHAGITSNIMQNAPYVGGSLIAGCSQYDAQLSMDNAAKDTKTTEDEASMDEEGANSEPRFRSLTYDNLKTYEEAHQARSTKNNTKWALKIFQEWHGQSYGDKLDFLATSDEDLALILRKFYCEAAPKASKVRVKKLGDEVAGTYHKNTLRNIRSALNRHLVDIGRPADIVHGAIFKSANRTLDGFFKHQTKSGMSRPTQHREVIEKSDLQKISEYFESGMSSPIVLRQCVWYNLAIHFVSRGVDFHQQLRLDSFDFHVADGKEYVTINHETQVKNYPGQIKDDASVDKRMYATGTTICPVATLKRMIKKTPPLAKSLFNSCDKEALLCPAASTHWYTTKSLSQRSFVNFMAEICKGSKTNGWYTAHCLRKTAMQALKEEGVVKFMFGHKKAESQKTPFKQPRTEQKKTVYKTLATLASANSAAEVSSSGMLSAVSSEESIESPSTVN